MTGKISVLMGIYNCADTLEQAVTCIQQQTYSNWELILCDDGSSDDTYAVALSLASSDNRIILLRNQTNIGLNSTLNHCLSVATGDYIARMDGDDECLPTRFEKQIDFLKNNPEFEIVSTPMILFDEHGDWGLTKCIPYPAKEDVIAGSPICHAPVMMTKQCIDAVKGYTEDPRMLRVEDVNLWVKLYASGYRCHNLEEPLYRMRNNQQAYQRRKYKYRINSTYVRLQGCKMMRMRPKYYVLALKPMIIGLVPTAIRRKLRRILH